MIKQLIQEVNEGKWKPNGSLPDDGGEIYFLENEEGKRLWVASGGLFLDFVDDYFRDTKTLGFFTRLYVWFCIRKKVREYRG